MKLAWFSNAPWCATGYGSQTAQACQRIKADGHDVAIISNYGLNGKSLNWNGIKVYPGGYDMWSNDTNAAHAADHFDDQPGWLMTLFDVWALRNPMFQRMNVASWVPVDHSPAPAAVVGFFRDNGAVPIAMSRFGEDELRRVGLDPLYVPHAIDTGIYKPTPTIGADTARSVFGIPETAFVVGMIANNKGKFPSRKGFDQAFLAFSAFRQAHDDAVLYVHAEATGMSDGINLHRLAAACGIPEDSVFFADQYAYRQGLPDPVMAGLYSSFDVLLCASRGEGFGIPVVEAQSCGVPVIVTNWTAQPELLGAGWAVDYRREWDEDQGSWWAMPLPEHIIASLEEAYEADGKRRREMAKGARTKALEYDAAKVYRKYWRPALKALEERLPSIEPVKAKPLDLSGVA